MAVTEATSNTLIVLDTDVFSYLRNRQQFIQEKIKKYFIDNKQFPTITSITIFEALQGIEKELHKGNIEQSDANLRKARINQLVTEHQILGFNQKSAMVASYIFPRLSQSDRNKHWRDLFIVATAVSHGFGLATQNQKDMELIANYLPDGLDLRLAIWKP